MVECVQVEVLDALMHQLRKISNHVPFNPEELAKKGEWMSAPELAAAAEKEKHRAIQLLRVSQLLAWIQCSCLNSPAGV
jgi:hypothetical protein